MNIQRIQEMVEKSQLYDKAVLEVMMLRVALAKALEGHPEKKIFMSDELMQQGDPYLEMKVWRDLSLNGAWFEVVRKSPLL